MQQALVILMGGSPLVGTQAVARRLAARLGYPCAGVEDLRRAIRAVTTAQSHPAFFMLEKKDHRQYFMTHSVGRLTADAEYLHEASWPAVKKVIEYHLDEGDPLVMEGWGLLPEKVAALADERVRGLWLIGSEAVFRRQVEASREMMGRSATADRLVEKILGRSLAWNEKLRQAVERLGLAYVEVGVDMVSGEIEERCQKIIQQ